MIMRLHHAPAGTVHLALMLALTFATGIIDAVGYLGLDRVFTGNMTGNVVVLVPRVIVTVTGALTTTGDRCRPREAP